jgi:hypothetical protein
VSTEILQESRFRGLQSPTYRPHSNYSNTNTEMDKQIHRRRPIGFWRSHPFPSSEWRLSDYSPK